MKKVTLVMLALTAVMQLPAQEQGRTLSLEEALEMTLSDNPAIRAAEFNRRAAQQERRAAIGLRMPQIGITGSYAYLGKDIEIDLNNMKAPVQNLAGQILQSGMIPSDYIPSISQMLSGAMAASWALPLQDRSLGFVGGDVTVPLWMGGKINAANRAARINEQTARSQGIQQRNALVSELVERYYGLALARQVVVVRQQVVDGVRKVGSRDVTEATAALVEELGRLSVTACVDYDPAEGAAAICGLDAPDAQALVTYTNELGTESTLTLTVGLPDGSGGRYVTVNDDPTIYRMEETALVQLLTLAETGLN